MARGTSVRWWIGAAVAAAALVIAVPVSAGALALGRQMAEARATEDELSRMLARLEIPQSWTTVAETQPDRHFDPLGFCVTSVADVRRCPTAYRTYTPPVLPTRLAELTAVLPDAAWSSDGRDCGNIPKGANGRLSLCKGEAVEGRLQVEVLLVAHVEEGTATSPTVKVTIERADRH